MAVKQTLAEALEARGYTTLTAVQEAVTEPETQGRDMLVSAQTGSGKTLGFGLAIAPQLLGDADVFQTANAPLALVIAPTRELALQVKRELGWLFAKAGAVVTSTVGGMDMRDERRALARGAHIVVATPGRLRDHIQRGSINLDALKAVVLDEADEMLDLGFREDLEFILEAAPVERQTLLFSATVPAAIGKMAKKYQNDALRIATTSGTKQHADITYRALRVAGRDGENAIVNVLRFYEAPNAIVFCNTRATVNRLTTRLSNRGFSVVALSGELSQGERTNALQAMRDGRARVCVATDVAARGIDLPNLDLVVHAELPTNQETLLHRSGRTGRAGRSGTSVMIVPPAARNKAQRLLGWAKLTAEWADAPSADEVSAKDEERMMSDPEWHEPIPERTLAAVEKLTAAFTPEQLAAAYLRVYSAKHSAPEELSDVGEAHKPREAFGPSTWFSLEGGRAAGADPKRLLPMLCKMGGITRDEIGAIRIQPDASFIEIRQSAVDGFLKAVGDDMVLEEGAALTKLDKVPKFEKGPRREGPRRDGPRRDGPRRDGPSRDGHKGRKGGKPRETPPVDWNDDPSPRHKKPKGGKPAHGDKPKYGDKPKHEGKPAYKDKPKQDGKPSYKDKPKHGDKPARKGKAAYGDKPHRSEKPADGDAKPFGKKPERKPAPKAAYNPSEKLGGKPARGKRSEDGENRPRGPKPPKGKASSKKNRARKEAAKFGGGEAPMRKNRKPS